MRLSFDEETSFEEVVEALRFVGSSIDKENDISISSCENDDSDNQMSDRRSASEITDKSIELNDTGSSIEKDGDPVESV